MSTDAADTQLPEPPKDMTPAQQSVWSSFVDTANKLGVERAVGAYAYAFNLHKIPVPVVKGASSAGGTSANSVVNSVDGSLQQPPGLNHVQKQLWKSFVTMSVPMMGLEAYVACILVVCG